MNLRNIVETTQHTADTLSGEVTQAVICVLQDRGLAPSDDSAVSGEWLRAAGAARVAVMHVLRGMSATDAADRVRGVERKVQ